MLYIVAADLILFIHTSFVAFIVVGFLLILIGKLRYWSWVRDPWFRLAHLAAIAIVVLQSWFGALCPLTTWEQVLREKGGDAVYSGTFISYWLEELLYYRAPEWVFGVAYTTFGALVLASWFWVRPRGFARLRDHAKP